MRGMMQAFALAAALWSAAASAQVVVDQNNLAVASNGDVYFGLSLYYAPSGDAPSRLGQLQSFTAGRTGTLTQIDLQLFRTNLVLPFSVALIAGEPGIAGPLTTLASRSFQTSALPPAPGLSPVAPLFSVDFSAANIAVTAGQKYSLLVSLPESGITAGGGLRRGLTWIYGTAPPDADDIYPPGYLTYAGGYNTLINSDGTREVTEADRGFRTFVDVAGVPEPAGWAMLIGGFGVLGAAGRRRGGVTLRQV